MSEINDLKDYSIKMIEVIIEDDVSDNKGFYSREHLTKYSRLHSEIKTRLIDNWENLTKNPNISLRETSIN